MVLNEHIRELISARKTPHKHNNKDLSCLISVILTWHACKYHACKCVVRTVLLFSTKFRARLCYSVKQAYKLQALYPVYICYAAHARKYKLNVLKIVLSDRWMPAASQT